MKGRKRILDRGIGLGKGLAVGKLHTVQGGLRGGTGHVGGRPDAWEALNAVPRSNGDFLLQVCRATLLFTVRQQSGHSRQWD